MTVYIYGLWDPRTYELRYIGKTNNLKSRFNGHIQDAKNNTGRNSYKNNWIKQLLSEGLEPSIDILEECTDDNWEESEIVWIKEGRENGLRLTNVSLGGDGVNHTPETIEKIRKTSTGRLHTQEAKDKISKANKGKTPFKGKVQSEEARKKIGNANRGKLGTNLGKTFTIEHREKIGKANKGKKHPGRKPTLEHCQNISKALIGKKHSPETIEKIRRIKSNTSDETRRRMSEAVKGRKWTDSQRTKMKDFKPMLGKHHSEETRNKISESNKGRIGPNKGKKFTDEQRQNMRNAHLGYVIPEETKRKMSEAAKLRWAKKRIENE